MAFNLIGGVVKAVGNVAGEVVSIPDKIIEDIVDHGSEKDKGERPQPTAILGGNSISKAGKYFFGPRSAIVVGPMVFAFFKAKGYSIGDTKVSDEDVAMANDILQGAFVNGTTVVLPKEVVVSIPGKNPDEPAHEKVVKASEIPDGSIGVDMAPSTINIIGDALKGSKEVQWNAYYVKGLFKKLAELEEHGAHITILSPAPDKFDCNVAAVGDCTDAAAMIESNQMKA